jgi:hypothetical protein
MPLFNPTDEEFEPLLERFRWFEEVLAIEYGEEDVDPDAEIPEAFNWLRLLPTELQLGLTDVECSLIYQNPASGYLCAIWDVTGEDDLPWAVFVADECGARLLGEYSLLAEEADTEKLDALLDRAVEELPDRLLSGEFERHPEKPAEDADEEPGGESVVSDVSVGGSAADK